ncbi:MAG: hypothetical protein RIA69_05975, partial [Cyclobacteriaceae bacterium]
SIVTHAFLDQKLIYTHGNPVEAEIVNEAAQYLYNSARDYAGSKWMSRCDCFGMRNGWQTRSSGGSFTTLVLFRDGTATSSYLSVTYNFVFN